MAQVVLTPDAETDLLELLSYLAEKSDRAADYLSDVVNLVFQNLAEYPLLVVHATNWCPACTACTQAATFFSTFRRRVIRTVFYSLPT